MNDNDFPIPASITAAFKCWHVESGEYTQDADSPHWGAFWEPLKVDLPDTARPSCCYYPFVSVHPNLLFLNGKWREVINSRVEYRNGQWFMRHGVATNTKWSRLLNLALEGQA